MSRIEIECKTRKVWKVKGADRSHLTILPAYRRAAWMLWNAKYPRERCECDSSTGYDCGIHGEAGHEHMVKVVTRLAGWLYWRDFGEHNKRCGTCRNSLWDMDDFSSGCCELTLKIVNRNSVCVYWKHP